MKKYLATIVTAISVILITAGFGVAEGMAVANAGGSFPYFHLGCLIIGGLTIVSIQQKYPKILMSESVGSFALFAVMVSLFTNPVAEFIKNLIS